MPEDERGGFVTALSEAGILPPDEVIGLLTSRLATLDKDNASQQADLRLWAERLPRVLLIETEYQLAMRVAQASWLRGLLGELVAGTISGMDGWRHMHETGETPPEFEELDELAKRGWTDEPRQDGADSDQGNSKNDPGPRCCNTANRGRNLTTSSAGNPQAAAMRPSHECTPGESSRD